MDDEHDFLFALHKNGLVQVNDGDIFRVQKIETTSNQLMLRNHVASTLNNKEQEIHKSLSTLLKDYKLYPVRVNAIGKRLDDQTNS